MIFLATNNGVLVCDRGDNWRVVRQTLAGQHATSIVARKGVILCGTTNGIYRSEDDGQTWREASQGLSHRHVRWMAYHPRIPDFDLAGTEPAAVFISPDGANTWSECGEVSSLRDRHKWSLPYSPEAGCVRGFAFHSSRAYAAVEVGGVLRSDDNGVHWKLAEGSDGNPDLRGLPEPWIYPDIHSVQVHPSSADLVFAPTGDGFYRSRDGGKTWKCLYDCYCRAAWVDPSDPDHILLGPADHVDVRGRIEETRDGGATWRLASNGLDVPWPRHMVERFTQIGAELFAVLSNGELLSASTILPQWQAVLPEVKNVNAVTAYDISS